MCCADFVKSQGRWRVTCGSAPMHFEGVAPRSSDPLWDCAVDPPAVPHAWFFPPYRARSHVTCAAAGELAASVPATDALPEVPAHASQSVLTTLDDR